MRHVCFVRTVPQTGYKAVESSLTVLGNSESRVSSNGAHLSASDRKFLGEAKGWLQRKSYGEAQCELDKISPAGRVHTDVLLASLELQSGLKNHPRTVEAGRLLVEGRRCLDRAWVWLTLADSLHQLGHTEEAYEKLKEFARHGSRDGLVHYRLAVYACLLGKPDEAKRHFSGAMNTPEGAKLKLAALEDEQLQDIWDFLCQP